MSSGYDVAQVCPNGHVTNESTESYPQHSKDYCEECGEKTITTCPNCSTGIRGQYWNDESPLIGGGYCPPAYCHKCGKPFPWTERRIQAAIDLAAEDGALSAEDKQQFNQSVNDITRNTPQSQVSASRLKKLLAKVGTGTGKAIRDILVDVASEAVKKTIWPTV